MELYGRRNQNAQEARAAVFLALAIALEQGLVGAKWIVLGTIMIRTVDLMPILTVV